MNMFIVITSVFFSNRKTTLVFYLIHLYFRESDSLMSGDIAHGYDHPSRYKKTSKIESKKKERERFNLYKHDDSLNNKISKQTKESDSRKKRFDQSRHHKRINSLQTFDEDSPTRFDDDERLHNFTHPKKHYRDNRKR